MSKGVSLILSTLLLASAGAAATEHWVAIPLPDGGLPESVDSTGIDVLPSGLRRAKIKEDCSHSRRRGCESIIRIELFDCQIRAFTIESAEIRQTDGTAKREGRPPSMPPEAPPPWFYSDPNPILDYVCVWTAQ
jgi:hypothetical protein